MFGAGCSVGMWVWGEGSFACREKFALICDEDFVDFLLELECFLLELLK